MKQFSPFTIAITAIAVAFVWSHATAKLETGKIALPLPTTASLVETVPVQN